MVKYKVLYKQAQLELDELKKKMGIAGLDKYEDIIAKALEHSDKFVDVFIHLSLVNLSFQADYPPIWGSVGLKLATTPSAGLLSASQVAGLAMLLALGLQPKLGDTPIETLGDILQSAEDWAKTDMEKKFNLKDCDGKRDMANFLKYKAYVDEDKYTFIVGWYDIKMGLYPEYGNLYKECKGIPPTGDGAGVR